MDNMYYIGFLKEDIDGTLTPEYGGFWIVNANNEEEAWDKLVKYIILNTREESSVDSFYEEVMMDVKGHYQILHIKNGIYEGEIC